MDDPDPLKEAPEPLEPALAAAPDAPAPADLLLAPTLPPPLPPLVPKREKTEARLGALSSLPVPRPLAMLIEELRRWVGGRGQTSGMG